MITKRIGVVVFMVLLSIMSYFDRIIMSIVGPIIVKEFSLSETEMGAVYSAFILSYAILMIPGGQLADRFGPRVVVTFMAMGAALFTSLTALGGIPGFGAYVGVVPSLLAIRLGLGVATAPLYPSCARMNANWVPLSQRARVWGWVASGAGIGGALSPILFSWMIGRYGWRTSFWLAGLVTGVLGIGWALYVRDHPPEQTWSREINRERRAPTPWQKLLTKPNLLLLTISYFAVAYFEYIFFYWVYYYFGEIRHMGMSQSAAYTTAVWVAWLVMTPVGGWMSDRLAATYGLSRGRRLVPMIGLTLSAILLCVGLNLAKPSAVAAMMCLSLGFASSSDGSYWASAIDAGGEHVGAACGILNSGGNLGGFLAPVLTAYIASRAGWSWGLYAGAIMIMIGVVTWMFIGSESSTPKPVASGSSI
jgi:ACS family glucarate transporter-like MFS transporter